MDGATPAGFSAHTSSRNDIDGILEDQLAGGIDLFFGSNAERYVPLKDKIEGAGYTFAQDLSQAQAAEGKVFAAFEEIPPRGSGGTKPSLASSPRRRSKNFPRTKTDFSLWWKKAI